MRMRDPEDLVTSALAFVCAAEDTLDRIRESGIERSEYAVHDDFEDARAACTGALLVVDKASVATEGPVIPCAAAVNLTPFRRPVPVEAAGGILTRHRHDRLEVLLIFRKGVWDLPKGKRDEGESVEDCAAREVREELGIEDVRLRGELGSTVHGYPDDRSYAVKTTRWYAMETSATRFAPEAKEQIEKVCWLEFGDACRRLGYENIRRHLRAVHSRLER